MTPTTSSAPESRLTLRDCTITAVASMEQIIGTAVSAVIGIMIPLIVLLSPHAMSPLVKGLVGSVGLIGIAIGSPIIGRLSDRHGYLLWFRLCPLIIAAGGAICWLGSTILWMVVGMFISGIGVGGGYSLDSAYISELMPPKWRGFMVGIAKATCSLGFLGASVAAWIMIKADPQADRWSDLALIIGVLGIITFLLRLHWAGSPKWLIDHGKKDEALKAARFFYGPIATAPTAETSSDDTSSAKTSWLDMLKGKNLAKAVFAGVPWACEGLGVYGFGVFLPVLVMALGIEKATATGMAQVLDSVAVTAVVNFFIVPGFIIGLAFMNRLNHVKMMSWGFLGSALGLAVLLFAFLLHMEAWVMILGFVIFELALNAGPHLLTYVIPTQIYSVEQRGAGAGLAAMNGKIGAVVGVILMPVLLDAGGMTLVLLVSIMVMVAGALIGTVYGKKLGLLGNSPVSN